jgi:hypothetical protein
MDSSVLVVSNEMVVPVRRVKGEIPAKGTLMPNSVST